MSGQSEEEKLPFDAPAGGPIVPSHSILDAAPLDAPDRSAVLLGFPTVVVGASAGGVQALRQLFTAMPADIGCAFIVVLHLQPERESLLAPLISHVTELPVVQAVHGTTVQVNRVYCAPPGEYVEIQQGRLVLSPMRQHPPRPKPVDHCMISLARDQRECAIGIVLSGTDGDGTLGVKAIKSEGGLTIAQTPESAAHASMPSSALATGMVDRELAIEHIPQALRDYVANIPLEFGKTRPDAPDSDERLFEILNRVRLSRGFDFRGYKTPMLVRRIHRRMALGAMSSEADYFEKLNKDADEVAALSSDFLISVTEFFREPEAWEVLIEEFLPRMLADKHRGEAVRVWVPACATGEEAYSMAMALLEQRRVAEFDLKVQVFATDIDRKALDVARHGCYPAAIEGAVSAERLARFFVPLDKGYQVRKGLRDVVLFAPHNLVGDPSFSRIDLLSCRNLLIYMAPELQRRVLQGFHFALDADRYLFLGRSETVSALSSGFVAASRRCRIYRRVGAARLPSARLSHLPTLERAGPTLVAQARRGPDYGRRVREALLEQHVTAAVLTNLRGEALYFYGRVQPFLDPPEGAPSSDLFAILHLVLRQPARTAIRTAFAERRACEATALLHPGGGHEEQVRLVAAPLKREDEELVLLSFERLPMKPQLPAGPELVAQPEAMRALEDELCRTRLELHAAIEELEATNEELKVANEEAMSVNEELQSSNEELETSKEELQSINEELSTVNAELQQKIEELERSNNDLANLLGSTSIPTLFLDRSLRIKRFTPASTRLFSLLEGDVGRPLAHIATEDDIHSLLADAESVLARLAPLEREVKTREGGHFLRRTLPYRTQDDRIDGVVITFTDVGEIKRAAEGMRRFASVMQGSSDAIIVHDLSGTVQAWNDSAEAMYGYSKTEVLGMSMFELLPEELRGDYEQQVERVVAGQAMQGIEARRRTRNGTVIDVSVSLSIVRADDGTPSAVALIERDITHRKQAEAALRASEQRFRSLANSAPVLIWTADKEGRIVFANDECTTVTGRSASALQGQAMLELLHPLDAQALASALAMQEPAEGDASARIEATARLQAANGHWRWMKIVVMPRLGSELGKVGCMIDIQDQIEAEEALRKADQRKDEFLAMLGHELRNPLAPIRNAAEVLKRVGGEDARIGWVRDTLVRQVGHVTRLVDDLLDISRITRGAITLRREPVNLGAAIEHALETVQPLLDRKAHRFEAQLPAEPLWVEGDPIRLIQIFENLLTNAAKYTDEGGEISVELSREGQQAVVHVRDDGLGIAAGMEARVFELFVQDERSIDRSQGGLGIGLSLVKHLVGLHGGDVGAHGRSSGRGSDFVVRLPLLAETGEQRPESEIDATPSGAGRVMLVDDDAESTASLAMVLQLGGFEVAQANDLNEALRVAARFAPEVVVMDLAMPGADGYEVARRLRALPALAHTKYVALSGFGRAQDFLRTGRAGFARHFAKPVDPDELERVLRELLAQAGRPQSPAE